MTTRNENYLIGGPHHGRRHLSHDGLRPEIQWRSPTSPPVVPGVHFSSDAELEFYETERYLLRQYDFYGRRVYVYVHVSLARVGENQLIGMIEHLFRDRKEVVEKDRKEVVGIADRCRRDREKVLWAADFLDEHDFPEEAEFVRWFLRSMASFSKKETLRI